MLYCSVVIAANELRLASKRLEDGKVMDADGNTGRGCREKKRKLSDLESECSSSSYPGTNFRYTTYYA